MHTKPTSLLALISLLTTTLAQTSTISLYIPGFDPQPLNASIIATSGSVTTYLVQCLPGTDSDDCGLDEPLTLTEGPQLAAYTFSAEMENGTLAFTGYENCSLDGSSTAVCTESYGGVSANYPGLSTVTYVSTDISFMPVIVTAAQAAATGGASVAPSTTASSTAVLSSSSSSSSPTKSSGASVTSTSAGSTSGVLVVQTTMPTSATGSTSSSTAGMPRITGSPGWVVGGAVAALALMA